MPKLAIYVPKKDMKEIERWRKKINYSKVFMTALGREIQIRSRAGRLPKDKLTAAAAHYRDQLVSAAGPLVDFGYRLGADQVLDCRLDTATLSKLAAVGSKPSLSRGEVALIEKSLEPVADRIEQFRGQQGIDETTHPAWREAVCRGYVQGVCETWRQVCERMKNPG